VSTIYQPPGQPFNPLYIDCVANALARQNVLFNTSSTVLVDVVSIPLVAGLFDTDGKKLIVELEGAFLTGGGNTIQIGINFDGVQRTATTLLGLNNAGFVGVLPEIKIFRRTADLAFHSQITGKVVSGTDDSAKVVLTGALVSSVDFTVPHNLTIQARVTNAADILQLRGLSAHVI
jgi:hypothetical protein